MEPTTLETGVWARDSSGCGLSSAVGQRDNPYYRAGDPGSQQSGAKNLETLPPALSHRSFRGSQPRSRVPPGQLAMEALHKYIDILGGPTTCRQALFSSEPLAA